jgi:hypothetical protein
VLWKAYVPTVSGLRPVRIESREGLHTAIWQYALSKTTDLAASLSKLGAIIPDFPYMPNSVLRSSNIMYRRLVCCGLFSVLDFDVCSGSEASVDPKYATHARAMINDGRRILHIFLGTLRNKNIRGLQPTKFWFVTASADGGGAIPSLFCFYEVFNMAQLSI